MKRILSILAVCLLLVSATGNPWTSYINDYSGIAVSEMKRTGVPASITLAQGILESGAGESALAMKANNHFGIKCHNDWDGKKYYQDDDRSDECFRVYPSVEASFRDHSDFLRGKDRYKSLFDLDPTDYKGWAQGLKKAGYATASNYATRLIEIIEDYKLYTYDRDVEVEVETPTQAEAPVKITEAVSPSDQSYKEYLKVSMNRTVYLQNGVPFVYSVDGESYESIARSFNLFTKEILSFNDLENDGPLEPGTLVYVARKKTQVGFAIGKYVVDRDGETLWEISQRFGVRLSSLRKMNILLTARPLEEGDTVNLRKSGK